MTMEPEELAKYFQDHRDEDSEWEEIPEQAERRPTSVVYSVRFSPGELTELRRVANTRGVSLSELIRSAVIEHVREADDAPVEVGAWRAKFYSRAHPANTGTRGAPVQESPFKTDVSTLVSS